MNQNSIRHCLKSTDFYTIEDALLYVELNEETIKND